ncbi:MAG TPA: phosphotransferase family protein [Amycolatopsis sp.]|nr:phosphotransferase family protein [Amycolatopsis sp.]
MSDEHGVDLQALGPWMDDRGLGAGPITAGRLLGGGSQNRLLSFHRGDREYVLRLPPRHPRPTSNPAISREVKFVDALADTAVPVPTIVASCADETVLGGPVFYVMERVDGVNPTVELTPAHTADGRVRAMGMAAVDTLTELGRLDYEALGLGGLGNPETFLERQVPRWLKELESYRHSSGYPGPDLPGVDDVARWLTEHRPAAGRPGIMHGDYHLANLMFRRDSTQVAAVVDWEMATIGEPLLDLGWLVATWPDGDDASMTGRIGKQGGLPGRAEIVRRYLDLTGADGDVVPWYAALACFKLGIVLEGTYARACAGRADARLGDMMHQHAQNLLRRAKTFMTADAATW